ncbi:transglycosylase SLT domain-containing protein [Dyella caseinilytica]|uniref:Transglycosylase SLT domain-containing protein n=1 Tax=Dyella caseinilytica TaxID=1849581 RepID=A0ABX7GP35_9GAMM|nr:transglycosylase SLT domain-containing protein [Dyella caseinilytica]QRN52181.1 transglycosylase SLT domain-containing protein [Dyella caseinilytica]GGA13928.1 lytic transglycosylase [Dyella caseinilytica]
MLNRPAARSLRLVLIAAGLAQLAACASGSKAAKPEPASVNALYSQLDQASQNYETALQQTRAGDMQAAQKTLDGALDQLKDASARCGNTPGCDPQRFFSVFDHLLRLKDGSFIGDETPGEGEEDTGETSSVPVAAGQAGAAGSVPEVQRSVTLLRGHQLSELIAMNGPVKAALEMWLTQWRGNLMDAYVNYQYLRQEMWPKYQQEGLPEALLFGILAKESGGKVHAVSRSGAAGPLQFMYATGLRFGLSDQDGFDTRFDPSESARANAEYMDEQLKVFNDNLELTLAAYNGGEGRMKRLVGDDTSVSFYDPRIYGQVSQETRDYVPSVLAAAWLFLHPDSYNLRFPKVDGLTSTVTLKRTASISELTVCLGSANDMPDGWFRTLRNLNPKLDPQQEQPVGTALQVPKSLEQVYAVRCVNGPWPILAADLHNAVVPVFPDPPPAAVDPVVRYTVRRGDTLGSIVRNHVSCSSETQVARMNNLKFNHVKVGQVLKLPSCR